MEEASLAMEDIAEETAEVAMLEADSAADEAEDGEEAPPAATAAQIWPETDCVSVRISDLRQLKATRECTQGISGGATGDDTRSGSGSYGSHSRATRACCVSNSASSTGDGGFQASRSARWNHGLQLGDGLSRDSGGQDGNGGESELHVDDCVC